jgi:two-component system KDP operon response regulator KdpE
MAKVCPHILVIEDEPPLRRYLRAILQSSNFLVTMAATVQEGQELVGRLGPDLVVLDLDLGLARDLRRWSRAPIIALSSQDREEDIVQALDAGADDYLVKPFGARVLVARIRVALRHSVLEAGTSGPSIELGPLKVDFVDRQISRDGVPVPLTPREFALLAILIQHAGKVVTHAQLRYDILGATTRSDALLRAHIAHLRKKLEPDPAKPCLILTKPGLGYCLGGFDRLRDRGIRPSPHREDRFPVLSGSPSSEGPAAPPWDLH